MIALNAARDRLLEILANFREGLASRELSAITNRPADRIFSETHESTDASHPDKGSL